MARLPPKVTSFFTRIFNHSRSVFIYSMQTRVDGRLTVAGSLDMFSDESFQKVKFRDLNINAFVHLFLPIG